MEVTFLQFFVYLESSWGKAKVLKYRNDYPLNRVLNLFLQLLGFVWVEVQKIEASYFTVWFKMSGYLDLAEDYIGELLCGLCSVYSSWKKTENKESYLSFSLIFY